MNDITNIPNCDSQNDRRDRKRLRNLKVHRLNCQFERKPQKLLNDQKLEKKKLSRRAPLAGLQLFGRQSIKKQFKFSVRISRMVRCYLRHRGLLKIPIVPKGEQKRKRERGGGWVVSCSGLAVKCLNANRMFFSFQKFKWTLSKIRFPWALKMSGIQPIHSSYLKSMELKIILIFS